MQGKVIKLLSTPSYLVTPQVNVLRSIPGDDSGLGEELVLVIGKDQLQEQDRRGATRARWFLHSLQQLELLDKQEPSGRSDSHVAGDRVRTVMMFNTVRKDVRVREYVMSEAGYSTLMALVGSVLEAAAASSSVSGSLQCVKCLAVFSWRSDQRCPYCGSSMVLEKEDSQQGEEEEELCLGIPACEMLDLEAITEAAGVEREESVTRLEEEPEDGREMSVTADIHSQLVTSSQQDNLPDLLPRPEPRRSSSPAPGEKTGSKERSSSPTLTRSNSSSDISVISSEASIEVIPAREKTPSLLAPVPALTKTSAVSPVQGRMADSDSSGSSQLVDSLLGLESCQSPAPSTPLVFKTPISTPVKKDATPPGSSYSSVTTSPVKLPRDTSELDDTAAFHSCQESSDTSIEEELQETDPDLPTSPINWNMTDFSKVDHRVQLYCEMFLFREEEDLLLLTKAELHVRSVARMFPGVLVVTNKKIYLLHITARETEEPGDWLELVTVGDVTRLTRLVGLVGRVGLALELLGNKHQPTPFYRLSSVAGGVQDESDCYQVIVGGRQRTELLADQLVERLQESVRSAPIPVTWLCPEQEAVLTLQLQLSPDPEAFMMARCVEAGKWQRVSVIFSASSIIVTEDFFYWLFTCKHRQLAVKHQVRIETLENLVSNQTSLKLLELSKFQYNFCPCRQYTKAAQRKYDWSFRSLC